MGINPGVKDSEKDEPGTVHWGLTRRYASSMRVTACVRARIPAHAQVRPRTPAAQRPYARRCRRVCVCTCLLAQASKAQARRRVNLHARYLACPPRRVPLQKTHLAQEKSIGAQTLLGGSNLMCIAPAERREHQRVAPSLAPLACQPPPLVGQQRGRAGFEARSCASS